MKKILIVSVSIVFLFLFISSSFAEFPRLWKNKELIKNIGISKEQVGKIKDLSITTEKKLIKVRADIELKEIDLREVLDEDKPNEGKAEGLIKGIMKLKTDARILKTKQMIDMKKILTPEQLEKLQQFKREHQMRGKQIRRKQMREKFGPPREHSMMP